VKIFVNLDEIVSRIDQAARKLAEPTAFYLGKLQDGLALDPLTGHSRLLVPFFASHPIARQILLTKSADVHNLLDLDHQDATILSWSLNPPEVTDAFEASTPPPQERIAAMRRCAKAGYPLRAVIMPVIPMSGWQDIYAEFLAELLTTIPLQRITLGGICSYPSARGLMEAKLGPDQTITTSLRESGGASPDGRARYSRAQRIHIYRHLIGVIHDHQPGLQIALCLEERPIFEALQMESTLGNCNCVL